MIDFKITVEYTCENMCTKEDLVNKTPKEIFNEITEGTDYYRLFCDKLEIKSIRAVDKNGKIFK